MLNWCFKFQTSEQYHSNDKLEVALLWLSLGLMVAWYKKQHLYVNADRLCHCWDYSDASESSPVLFQAQYCLLRTWLLLDVYRVVKVLPVMQPEVATPPHPIWGGCVWSFWQARHKSLFCFHLITALKHEALWRGSAIIQLNSEKEITACLQQVHLQSLPFPSSGINRYTNVDTYTHTCTYASKQGLTVMPALFLAVFYMHKSSPTSLLSLEKHKQHNHSATQIRTWSHHNAASRSCSRRGNSVSVCTTEKREGRTEVERGGKCKI